MVQRACCAFGRMSATMAPDPEVTTVVTNGKRDRAVIVEGDTVLVLDILGDR